MSLGQVTLQFLTPGDRAISSYRRKLADSLGSMVSDGPRLNADWQAPDLNHNLISGAILVEYGETRLLLMADGEASLWKELLADLAANGERLPAPVQLVKVAHHGSLNGYVKELYQFVCHPESTIAVVTPFARHSSPLPRQEGLSALRPHVASVFCTNRSAAARSSGLPWESGRTAPLEDYPAMPQAWILVLQARPELKQILAPALGGPPYLHPGAVLPLELMPDCARNPELLQLLHPDLRNIWIAGPRPDIYDEFRASFYFDHDGREDESRRYIGAGAGRLAAGLAS